MKAKFTESVSNARNYANDKELVDAYSVVGKLEGKLREVVTCRAYMARSRNASTVYASLWVNGSNYTSGKGSAGGYGYHKVSAAIDEAIRSAGIKLFGDVYDSNHRWNHGEKRENTPAEIAAIKRKLAKQAASISGIGDSAIESALLAIAKAAGARGEMIVIHH